MGIVVGDGDAYRALRKLDVYRTVYEILMDSLALDVQDIRGDSKLEEDLGAESIDIVDIEHKLGRAYDIEIPREGIGKGLTVDSLVRYVQGKLEEREDGRAS